jgi:hypothetical protein
VDSHSSHPLSALFNREDSGTSITQNITSKHDEGHIESGNLIQDQTRIEMKNSSENDIDEPVQDKKEDEDNDEASDSEENIEEVCIFSISRFRPSLN